MGLGIAGFIREMEEREEKKARGEPAGKVAPSGKALDGVEKIRSIIPDLRKLEEDPQHIKTLSGDSLKTLCELEVLDISMNERGKSLIESFKVIEQVTASIPKQEEETKKLADKVEALPAKGNDVEIQYRKAQPEKELPKSVYLIETPRETQPKEEKEQPGSLKQGKSGREPLIAPRRR